MTIALCAFPFVLVIVAAFVCNSFGFERPKWRG